MIQKSSKYSLVTREKKFWKGKQESSCSILKVCEDRLSGKRNLVEDGGVAQLGEHLPCTQGVRSSILLISTKGTRLGSER